MKKFFFESLDVIKKNKIIFYFVLAITVLALLIGYILSRSDNHQINILKEQILLEISQYGPILNIISALDKNNIFYSALYTFFYNLFFGAFLSTTLTGLFFPLPILIMLQRGILIGLLFGSEKSSLLYYIILFGTLILEFSAYLLSSTAGIVIGLSFFMPKKYGTLNRFIAFKKSLLEAIKIYYLVIFLLFIAAFWEILGLYFLK